MTRPSSPRRPTSLKRLAKSFAVTWLRHAPNSPASGNAYAKYRADPAGYARAVLRQTWWSKQVEVAEALLRPPHRVLVRASHSVGKSHLAGGLVNWWYDTRNPSICLTTAPKYDQVRDVVWKEVRLQRRGRPGFVGPKLPRMEDAPDHYACGLTAERSEGIQGQHGAAVLAIIDEAVGVDPFVWRAIDSLAMGEEFAVLAICNPTYTDSEFYRRELQRDVPWHVITISCLEHPNILAECRGDPPWVPAAVRRDWVDERVREWCAPVAAEDRQPGDIVWPLGSGQLWRPGPEAESRLLGRWPSQAFGVWSDTLFTAAESANLPLPPPATLPVIGCDVARFGDDDSAFVVRCGPVALEAVTVNGLAVDAVAGRLVQLAERYAVWTSARREPTAAPVDPRTVRLQVDDSGVGGGVVDILRGTGYRVVPVNAAGVPRREDRYPNVRSELWFDAADRARQGALDLSRLPQGQRHRLRVECLAPRWQLDARGRRVVEPKAELKKADRLGRSPDLADATNIGFYERPSAESPAVATEAGPAR